MTDSIRDLRGVQFAQVEAELLRDPTVPDALIRLYAVLLTYGPEGIFPGQVRLAADTGTTRETVNRRLGQMRDLGLIAWEQRPGSSNEYYILGYAHMMSQGGVMRGSHPEGEGVTPGSHPKGGDVIVGSQGVCRGDHTGCDRGITRSRSNDLDPPKHMVGGLDPGQLWLTALQELELQMTRATFEDWIQPCSVSAATQMDGGLRIVLVAPNEYVRDWVANRLHKVIERTLGALVEGDLEMVYLVGQAEAA